MIYNPEQRLIVYKKEFPQYGLSEFATNEELANRGFFNLVETEKPEHSRYQAAVPGTPEKVEIESGVFYKKTWEIIDLFTTDIYRNGILVTVEQQKQEHDKAQIDILQSQYLEQVDKLINSKAISYGYFSIDTAVSYADEPSVPKFQIEGQALRQWRSLVYLSCYQLLTQAYEGTIEINNFNDLRALLPKFPLDPEEEVVIPPPPAFDINKVPVEELPELTEPVFPPGFEMYLGFDGTNPEVLPDYAQDQLNNYILSERRRLYMEQHFGPPSSPEPIPDPIPVPEQPVSEPAPAEPTAAPTEPTPTPTEPQPNTVDPTDISSTTP